MCSVLVCVDVAAWRWMETQDDGQRNVLEFKAAGILWLGRHRSMNQFSVDFAANDKSCTVRQHVSNVSLNGMSRYCAPFTHSPRQQNEVCHVSGKGNKLFLFRILRLFRLHFCYSSH